MKQTQVGAITEALINGEKVSNLTAFKDFGAFRLGAQIFYIEKKFGITLNRNDIKGKTRFKTSFVCTEYSMKRKDAQLVKRMMKESKN